jgi:hypothetical protein
MGSRCSVCVCLCIPLIVARQQLGKNPPIVARQRLGSVKILTIVARQRLGRNVTAVTNTHITVEELLVALFSMWPVSYEGKFIPPSLLGKNPLIVARRRLGRNVTAVTNTHATIEELLDASFSIWPVSYQGK